MAFLFHGVFWKFLPFLLLGPSVGDTATRCAAAVPEGFRPSSRWMPGSVPVWRDLLQSRSGAPGLLAKEGQDVIQGSISRGMQRQGSALIAAESSFCAALEHLLITASSHRLVNVFCTHPFHQSYFHQVILFITRLKGHSCCKTTSSIYCSDYVSTDFYNSPSSVS